MSEIKPPLTSRLHPPLRFNEFFFFVVFFVCLLQPTLVVSFEFILEQPCLFNFTSFIIFLYNTLRYTHFRRVTYMQCLCVFVCQNAQDFIRMKWTTSLVAGADEAFFAWLDCILSGVRLSVCNPRIKTRY